MSSFTLSILWLLLLRMTHHPSHLQPMLPQRLIVHSSILDLCRELYLLPAVCQRSHYSTQPIRTQTHMYIYSTVERSLLIVHKHFVLSAYYSFTLAVLHFFIWFYTFFIAFPMVLSAEFRGSFFGFLPVCFISIQCQIQYIRELLFF